MSLQVNEWGFILFILVVIIVRWLTTQWNGIHMEYILYIRYLYAIFYKDFVHEITSKWMRVYAIAVKL